jgi:hypothetical protein
MPHKHAAGDIHSMQVISRAGIALAIVCLSALSTVTLAVRRESSDGLLAQQKDARNVDRNGLAVQGYDVVAYITDGAAVRGSANFEHRWENAIWRFASAQHRDEFARSPERFAPQFGGYCAWAVSRGYTADVDPGAWRVIEGKLYLNYSRRVQRMWEQDIAGNIAKGRTNWPGVLAK